VNYGKVPGSDPLDPRLQLLPNVAYKITSLEIAKLLAPFVDAGLIPENQLDSVSDWIENLENAMVQFVKNNEVARKSGQNPDQFISLAQFSGETGVDLTPFLDQVGLAGAENVFLYGDASLWYDLFKQIMGSNEDESFRDLKFYYLFKLAISHYNKLGAKHFNLHYEVLHNENGKSKAVRRHGT
jgi:hypothetical protein